MACPFENAIGHQGVSVSRHALVRGDLVVVAAVGQDLRGNSDDDYVAAIKMWLCF